MPASDPRKSRYDIFLSYRHSTASELAQFVRSEFEARGYRVFLDVRSLGSGKFDERLLEVIARTPTFLLLLSPGALDSCSSQGDWLGFEIKRALETKRGIVLLMTSGFKFPDRLPKDIAELPSYNGTTYVHEHADQVIQKIRNWLPPPRRKRRLQLAGVPVLLALVGAGYILRDKVRLTGKELDAVPWADRLRGASFTVLPPEGSATTPWRIHFSRHDPGCTLTSPRGDLLDGTFAMEGSTLSLRVPRDSSYGEMPLGLPAQPNRSWSGELVEDATSERFQWQHDGRTLLLAEQ